MSAGEAKRAAMRLFHSGMDDFIAEITRTKARPRQLSGLVNGRLASVSREIERSLGTGDRLADARLLFVIRYCLAVASIEYRQRVWPYEPMDFARRAGELWEALCKSAWTFPLKDGLEPLTPPTLTEVRDRAIGRLRGLIPGHANEEAVVALLREMTAPLDRISMASDVVCRLRGTPVVLDFKLAYGSNEKGNRNRLCDVAWAYRKWDALTDLRMLVLREENNGYLDSLRTGPGRWTVVTGRDVYDNVAEITGLDVSALVDEVVDFSADLSDASLKHFTDRGVSGYLDWRCIGKP